MKIQKVLVLGAGLIGGSIIRAIRKYQPELILEAAVRNPDAYPQLKSFTEKIYPVSEIHPSDWDLVIITTPTDSIAGFVREMVFKIPAHSIITDAGSIKGFIEEACADIPQYIGSHPMAGKEKGGFEHSDPDLLKNRVVAVCPKPQTPFEKIRALCGFWEALGAETVVKSAAEHDEIVAYTSHFPHVMSFLFARLGDELSLNPEKIAGNSFADFTRIAASSPLMWTEIFRLNKKNLVFLVENFIKFLFDFKQAMEKEDWVFIEKTISQSNLFMEKLSNTKNIGSEDSNGRRTV